VREIPGNKSIPRRDPPPSGNLLREGLLMSSRESLDPEQLLRLARLETGDALGRLLEHYRGYLGLLARVQIGRRLQGKIEAADLVQETFLEAHRNFGRFEGATEGEFVNWLRQILAANLAMTLRRFLGTKSRDVRLERELQAEMDESSRVLDGGLVASSSSPSQRAIHREQAILLADALGRLPEAYREVIILRHLEGLSFPEVARRMDRSLDSVKNIWTRALGRLRQSLGEQP
jgi:RNA polymerase sigma-70 factor (ECF subfamily)